MWASSGMSTAVKLVLVRLNPQSTRSGLIFERNQPCSLKFDNFLAAVAALSTQLSTAALDKHPQSKERGITLDLGFSSFITAVPDGLASLGCNRLQFTLVDCPGHASLIRTIIGGAQIIDMMLLVIDVTKGIQASHSITSISMIK